MHLCVDSCGCFIVSGKEMNMFSFCTVYSLFFVCTRHENGQTIVQNIISVMLSYYLITALPIKNGYARATFTMEPKAFMCFHFVRGLFDAIRINPSYCHFHILPHKVARVISVLFLCVRKRTFFIHADARKTVEDTILLLLKCR